MKSTLMRCFSLSPAMSSSTWRWMVTSSAVVGSSATSSLGSQASAMANITRCCWPPDSSNGYDARRRLGSGMPTSLSRSSALFIAARRFSRMCLRSGSHSCAPMVNTGLSEVIGSWKTQAMSRPRSACSSGIEACSKSLPRHSTRPWRCALSGSRFSMAIAVTLLPDPDSPTSATVEFSAMSKLTPSPSRPTAWARCSTPPTLPMRKSTIRFWMLKSMTTGLPPGRQGVARAHAWLGHAGQCERQGP